MYPQHPRFDTRDEGERARFVLFALGQRAAEAATVRAWATGQMQGHGQERRVLACGDLNDTPDAATTQLLLGPPGSQLGTGGFSHPDDGDGNRLWNLAPEMPAGNPATGEEAANWSRVNNGVKELIDQVLVSHQLVQALDSTKSLPIDGIKSATADPASLAGMTAPCDHRPDRRARAPPIAYSARLNPFGVPGSSRGEQRMLRLTANPRRNLRLSP